MRWILPVLVILVLALTPASAQVPPEGHNQVVTTGVGRVEVTPDQATVTIGATLQRPSAGEAWTETSRLVTQMLARMQQLGVRKEQIRTSTIQLTPIYATPSGWQPHINGYQGSYTATLTLDDFSLVGRVIDASVEAGANNLWGISFGLRDPSKVRKDALTLAVRDAREKAEVIAQAAGLHLRGIDRIVEGGVTVPTIRGGMNAAPTQTPIEPGTLTIVAQVSAVFVY
jgi:uncharacterized protein YggE